MQPHVVRGIGLGGSTAGGTTLRLAAAIGSSRHVVVDSENILLESKCISAARKVHLLARASTLVHARLLNARYDRFPSMLSPAAWCRFASRPLSTPPLCSHQFTCREMTISRTCRVGNIFRHLPSSLINLHAMRRRCEDYLLANIGAERYSSRCLGCRPAVAVAPQRRLFSCHLSRVIPISCRHAIAPLLDLPNSDIAAEIIGLPQPVLHVAPKAYLSVAAVSLMLVIYARVD